MRVIAGEAKGQRLEVPKGSHTRPTTYLAREVIFSILGSVISEGTRALDLYAGTGALGIEALSRGIGWVDFIEQEPRCCAIIRQNLKHTGLAARGHVYCCSVAKGLAFLEEKYNIIFVDPPYSDTSIDNFLRQLATSKLLTAGSAVVVFHSRHLPLPPDYGRLQLLKERQHGDTCISIYRGE